MATLSDSTPMCISTASQLADFLSSINRETDSFYLDLEGNNLSRHGTLTLITILVYPRKETFIIDVQTLGASAFGPTDSTTISLKSVLEDASVPKYLWDCRNDADALWALYKVGLAGVIDIQLLQNASTASPSPYVVLQRPPKKFLSSLKNAVRLDLPTVDPVDARERSRWLNTKDEVSKLMAAKNNKKKNNNPFSVRPLEARILEYCKGDVVYLPALHDLYKKKLIQLQPGGSGRSSSSWLQKAKQESIRRAEELARSPHYDPHSPDKARSPWAAEAESLVVIRDNMTESEWDKIDDALNEARIEEEEEEEERWARLEEHLQEVWVGETHDDRDDFDFYDEGPTSVRDIVSDADYGMYYSD